MSTSISIKELKELDPSSYQIVDIRDAVEISHGAIPGALVMKTEEIETSDAIDRSKKTIICCSRGRFSVAAAEELQEKGWDAVSLEGGYIAWLMDVMSAPEEQDRRQTWRRVSAKNSKSRSGPNLRKRSIRTSW